MSESEPFGGPAPYDADDRANYPDAVFAELGARCGLDGSQVALDLGCGVGQATFPLARRVRHVVAVDPDPAMLCKAGSQAEEQGIANVSWRQGTTEDLLPMELEVVDLAVMASSFHWMDRDATLRTLDHVLAPDGAVVVIGSTSGTASDSTDRPPWVNAVIETRRRWIPPRQRWLGDTANDARAYSVIRREHVAALRRSAFEQLETFELRWERRHDVDSLLRLQLTVPDATPRALGGRVHGFTADLRRALLRAQPDGVFVETITTEALIGRQLR